MYVPHNHYMFNTYRMDLGLLDSNTRFFSSIPDGIYYGQYESHNYMNGKLYERNLPDKLLKPSIDFRSLSTRDVLYPMADERLKYKPRDYETYNPEKLFAPMNRKGPFEGFCPDDESKLRNQCFALQHGAEQAYYIPSSDSDLYKVEVPKNVDNVQQPFPNLFHVPKMNTDVHYVVGNIGQDMFFNHTNMQLRNIPCDSYKGVCTR